MYYIIILIIGLAIGYVLGKQEQKTIQRPIKRRKFKKRTGNNIEPKSTSPIRYGGQMPR